MTLAVTAQPIQAQTPSVPEVPEGLEVGRPRAVDTVVTPFNLAQGASHTVDCVDPTTPNDVVNGYTNSASVVATEITTPKVSNKARVTATAVSPMAVSSVTADEVATPVVSNQVDVAVTIPAGSGLVAGTVTETGAGDPIAGAVVAVLSTATCSPVAVATANTAGGYVAAPPAGTYFVNVLDHAQGHAAGFSGAPTTVVVPGAATVTADAELAAATATGTTAHLTGTITTTTGGNLEGVAVMAARTSDFGLATADLTDASGNYDIALDPGTYKLAFYDPTGTHRFEWHDNQPASGLGSAATVTAGSPTGG